MTRLHGDEDPPFEIIPGDPTSPVILHVPHAATRIPSWVRDRILLDDEELALELSWMTDADTDVIAAQAAELASRQVARRPWQLVNRLSRLVVDPERFPDESEELSEQGMGAVYTRTSHGQPLRDEDAEHRERLLDNFFRPYAAAMSELVDQRLATAGRAVILDVHSYPKDPLPYELHAADRRPQVCLGVDADHSPVDLLDAARREFADWELAVNEPFAGCYVPLKHFRRDHRVSALMIEIRRDVYQERSAGLTGLAAGLAAHIEVVT